MQVWLLTHHKIRVLKILDYFVAGKIIKFFHIGRTVRLVFFPRQPSHLSVKVRILRTHFFTKDF